MSMKKLTVYATLTALLAGVVTVVTWQMNGWPTVAGQPLTYLSFVAWAAYFLFGANVQGAVKAFTSMLAGIIAAILMFALSIAFGFAPWWAVPLAVFILVIPMMFCERIPIFSNVAAVFMGTGLYFSISAAGGVAGFTIDQYLLVGATELFYVLIGFAAGWLTIQFNIMASKEKAPEKAAQGAD